MRCGRASESSSLCSSWAVYGRVTNMMHGGIAVPWRGSGGELVEAPVGGGDVAVVLGAGQRPVHLE